MSKFMVVNSAFISGFKWSPALKELVKIEFADLIFIESLKSILPAEDFELDFVVFDYGGNIVSFEVKSGKSLDESSRARKQFKNCRNLLALLAKINQLTEEPTVKQYCVLPNIVLASDEIADDDVLTNAELVNFNQWWAKNIAVAQQKCSNGSNKENILKLLKVTSVSFSVTGRYHSSK